MPKGGKNVKPFYVKAITGAALAASLLSGSVVPALAAENEPAQEEIAEQIPEEDFEPEARDIRDLKQVSKYSLEPGKYYMVVNPDIKSKGKFIQNRNTSFKIKVLKSYEKDRLFGTVRTAQVIDCKNGQTKEINCDDFIFYALEE